MKALPILALTLAVGAQALGAQGDARARLLTRLGCTDCHTVAALKIKGGADVGPDLSAAYAEVPFRYGVPFERFFDQPPSVMRLVLGGRRPSLRRAEQDSLIALFRGLYLEQLARLDSAQHRIRVVGAVDQQLLKRQ